MISNKNILKENLIKWLECEYDHSSSVDQIENAKITRTGNLVQITYDNGVFDIVKVDNNDNILEQVTSPLKFKIGDVLEPKMPKWLKDDVLKEYLTELRWNNLDDVLIDGNLWSLYLNELDYKKYTLSESPKDLIPFLILQIKEKINKFI